MRNRLSVLIFVVFSFLTFVSSTRAQLPLRYTVRNTSDVVVAGACGNGTGPGTIDCSLRGAIQAANAGSGAIFFAIPVSDPNCTAGVCTITLTAALPALDTNNVFINGPGADKLMVRRNTGSSTSTFRIFLVNAPGTVGISGITISGGNTGIEYGAGIYHVLGTLNVNSCTITNNQSINPGGGIYNTGGTLNVTNSTISDNKGSAGGGIFNTAGGVLTLTNSTLSENHASFGGGIYNGSGSGTSIANIVNSTLSQNESPYRGGGIYNDKDGRLNVTNSTISGNFILPGGESGGGINNFGIANVRNNIIALNTAVTTGPDVQGSFVSTGFNLIGKTDASIGFPVSTDQTGTIAAPLNPILDPAGLQNNGGPTRTIALLHGSPAIDKGTSSGLTGVLTTDQRGFAFRRTVDSFAVANATGGNGTDIGAFERQSNSPADFDGDNKTDISIFRPSVGQWWINQSSNGSTFATQFGVATDRITLRDYTGDGKKDIAIWRPSTGFWFVLRSEDLSFYSFPLGVNGDIPVPSDYDGDGKSDPAVFRPSNSTWYITRSSDQGATIDPFGTTGDIPVAADYDGDSKADEAIFRPSTGQWWLKRSTAGVVVVSFGTSTDKLVRGDYTGDGKADVAFWRPSTGFWFVVRSEDLSFFSFPFGSSSDVVTPGDYDGDGKFDAAIFRPSETNWYVQRSTAGLLIQQFGAPGDLPLANSFVP